MDLQSYRDEYTRQGFVIVRQLLPAADFQTLQQELDRYIREVVPTLPDAHAFYEEKGRPETLKQMQHMGCDPFFRMYGQHFRWRGLAEALLGEPAEAMEPEWFNKPPNTRHVTPPHQDNYYFCLRPSNVLTIWMALDKVDEENGCLRYVPGSHLRGVRPHGASRILGFSQGITDFGDADRAVEVNVCLEPGDVVAHHGETIHRADANVSSVRHRRAFAIVYRGQSCQRDEAAFQRYREQLQRQHQAHGLATAT